MEYHQLERNVLLHQRQQVAHQHGQPAVAAHRNHLPVRVGELGTHRLRKPARHRAVQQTVEEPALAVGLQVPQHPHHRGADIGHEDRIVRRLRVEHVGDELRVDQVGVVLLALMVVTLEVLGPLLEMRLEVAVIGLRRDQRGQRREGRLRIADQPHVDRRPAAQMRGIDIDLHDLLRLGVELGVGKVAAQRDDQIGILQRLHARLVAQDAVHSDIVGVVRFEEFLGPRGVHHRCLHLLAEGDDLLARIARPDPGIDRHLAGGIDHRGQLGHLGIVRTAHGLRAIDFPVHRILVALGEHVAVDDDDRHALLRQRGLRGLGHDPPGLRGVRDIFAEVRVLLVNLLLVDFLREVEAALRAGDVRSDQHDRRAVAVAFVNAVHEVKRTRPAGARADRQFAGHVGFPARSKRAHLFMADGNPAKIALGDGVGEMIDRIAGYSVDPFRTRLLQGIDDDLSHLLRHI